MKIIFLDVDGVLNNTPWLGVRFKEKEYESHEHSYFDPHNVANLNEITDKTGAKIVVSSSWRIGKTVEDLKQLFSAVGVTGEVIDKTKRLNYANSTNSVPRGCEILEWINDNKSILGTNLLSWKDYAIIDDDGDMLYWQRKNFFQTDPCCGLSATIAYKIINHLR